MKIAKYRKDDSLMIKVYEITSSAKDVLTSLLDKILITLFVLAAIYALASMMPLIADKLKKDTAKSKEFKELVQDFVKVVVGLIMIAVFGFAISPIKHGDETKLLNKDQYTFQIVDNKLIQLKKDDRKLKMTVQKSGDSKENETDALEIVTETDEHYLCKANTSDRDTYVKVRKNEHNFVKESE